MKKQGAIIFIVIILILVIAVFAFINKEKFAASDNNKDNSNGQVSADEYKNLQTDEDVFGAIDSALAYTG